jgi:hypothetical protein
LLFLLGRRRRRRRRSSSRRRMELATELGHLLVFAFLFFFSSFMVGSVITDVTMGALCPGRDECSLAIYLTGLQQAVSYIYIYIY